MNVYSILVENKFLSGLGRFKGIICPKSSGWEHYFGDIIEFIGK